MNMTQQTQNNLTTKSLFDKLVSPRLASNLSLVGLTVALATGCASRPKVVAELEGPNGQVYKLKSVKDRTATVNISPEGEVRMGSYLANQSIGDINRVEHRQVTTTSDLRGGNIRAKQ